MSQPGRADVEVEGTYSFDIVIRGYDRIQVDALVERLSSDMNALRADRDALANRTEKLTEQLAAMARETETLRTKAPPVAESNFESMGARISTMLRLAEEEASDIRRVAGAEQSRARTDLESATRESSAMRTEAREEADMVTKQAHDEADRVTKQARIEADRVARQAHIEAENLTRQAHDEAQRVREEAESAAADTVADAQRLADERAVRATEAVELAEAQSRSQIAKAQDDFDQSLKSRQAEAARIELERDQASRQDMDARIDQARTQAEKIIGDAEQRLAELEAQQLDVSSWLDHLRQALSTVPLVDLPEREWPIEDDDRSTTGRHGPAPKPPDPQPDSSHDRPPVPAPDPVPDADYERRDGTVLGREDILEYRHMRRSRR